ncbi:hypothetical protein ACXYTP_18670 [Tsukamurella ocularis]|uniref:hypothetical protein n=1 Tax=Tsukamurella ocularis TaxID=1970234 RepID=UPI0039EE29AD
MTITATWTRAPKLGDRVQLIDPRPIPRKLRAAIEAGETVLGTVVHVRRPSGISGHGAPPVGIQWDTYGTEISNHDQKRLALVEGVPTPKQTEAAVRVFSDPAATAEQRAEAARVVEAADRAASIKAAKANR